jgi:hypothetical protein
LNDYLNSAATTSEQRKYNDGNSSSDNNKINEQSNIDRSNNTSTNKRLERRDKIRKASSPLRGNAVSNGVGGHHNHSHCYEGPSINARLDNEDVQKAFEMRKEFDKELQ